MKIEEIAEGNYRTYNSLRVQREYPNLKNLILPPVFRRYVVLDVISDQLFLTEENLQLIESQHGELNNRHHATNLIVPRNSIIAKPVYDSSRDNRFEAQLPVILYPFFPSHLALPCKPGEHVWVMFESVTEVKSLGYWFCRIVGPDHIDDVNHSHAPREHDTSFQIVESDENLRIYEEITGESLKPRYFFKNGLFRSLVTDPQSGEKQAFVDATSVTLLANDLINAYENVISGSTASSKIIKEPVPRYKKWPGELSLEGSNNTLISMGIDKSVFGPDAGAIDVVAGRGTKELTLGMIAENESGFVGTSTSIKGKELDKYYKNLTMFEGSADYINDRSRILVTQRTKPDAKFEISSYNSKFSNANAGTGSPLVQDSEEGDAAVVIKTDKVRIIARSDIQLLVKGFSEDTSASGTKVKSERPNSESNKWASITIKSNGDIIFIPSDEGYIKLGGDDADKGIVCSAVPVAKVAGGVVGEAIQNTAGGRLGGSSAATSAGNTPLISPKHGSYANKVLVK